MTQPQPGILAPLPRHARFVCFRARAGIDPEPTLRKMAAVFDNERHVVGLGPSLVASVGRVVEGLREFPVVPDAAVAVPSTPAALWYWLRDDDRGDLLHASRRTIALLSPAFAPISAVDAFQFRDSRDLTGYEDGTENPVGDAARVTALRPDGSSFVAVQQWVHDLAAFEAMTSAARDDVFGRRQADNEEFEEAPASAHVKRTAQESFEPPAFVVRRSMPWSDATRAGLMFIAFGRSFDPFEAQLHRMMGLDDGILDGLFSFTRPISGSFFWCPPIARGKLDLHDVLRPTS